VKRIRLPLVFLLGFERPEVQSTIGRLGNSKNMCAASLPK
jgi:hypothetical protein